MAQFCWSMTLKKNVPNILNFIGISRSGDNPMNVRSTLMISPFSIISLSHSIHFQVEPDITHQDSSNDAYLCKYYRGFTDEMLHF